MTRKADPRLLDLALSIADGRPFEWPSPAATALHGPTLEALRMLERIGESHGGPGLAPVAPASPTEPALESWGPLALRERIGAGAFGEVYRAYDATLQREVALKLVSLPDAAGTEAFLAEARRLARIRHPNVVTVHGADRHHGRVGLWMDLVVGITLEQHLGRGGPIGAREAAVMGIELCRALAAIHDAGLVHRDLKTSNVMREHGGRLVLMDFGSSVELASTTSPSTFYGTPIAMAPEQLVGGPLTPATDLYALGVLLYRLASGHYPIEASDVAELIEKHRRLDSVPLRSRRPDLPAAFVRVVERALEPDAARRYDSAAAMEKALSAVLEDSAPMPRLGRRATRVRSVAAVAGIAVVGLLAAWMLWGPDAARRRSAATAPMTTQASAPPVSAPPAADARALTASARLLRETGSGTTTLANGDRIAPGDALFLRFESPETAYVYVLNEDRAGAVTVLFPAPAFDMANPLPAGVHRLPGAGAGEPIDWQVTSAGGREVVIVIAARGPQPELERDLAALPRPREGAPVVYGLAAPGTVHRLRGIAGAIARRDLPPAGGRLSDVLRGLPGSSASSHDHWIWQIELDNPGR